MAGCGKAWNGNHVVEGAPLRCGNKLYHRVPGGKEKDLTTEVVLCDQCQPKESSDEPIR